MGHAKPRQDDNLLAVRAATEGVSCYDETASGGCSPGKRFTGSFSDRLTVANDPLNATDPSGECGTRYKDGGCKVSLSRKASDADKQAASDLENSLNAADEKINSLSDDALVQVTDGKGNIQETVSGKQFKNIWNKTSWSIASADKEQNNGGAGGGITVRTDFKGNFRSAKAELSAAAIGGYQSTAVRKGSTAAYGVDSIIFHELGHATPLGIAVNNYYPTDKVRDGMINSDPRNILKEQLAHRTGQALSGAAGAGFVCSTSVFGC